jgi:hypothetical protein
MIILVITNNKKAQAMNSLRFFVEVMQLRVILANCLLPFACYVLLFFAT